MQLPSNMLMASKHIRPSYYMGICMALWAVCSGCTALVQNYTGLVVARFFLGIAEAPCEFSHKTRNPGRADKSSLSRSIVSLVSFLYSQRDCYENCNSLYGKHLVYRLFWPHCGCHICDH